MKDKDIFKEVFSEKLKEHSSDVNPNLWNSIQSQVAGSASTGASAGASASGSSLGIGAKIAIGIISVASIGTVVVLSLDEDKSSIVEDSNKNTVALVDDKKETIQESDKEDIQLEKAIKENVSNSAKEDSDKLEDTDKSNELDNNQEISKTRRTESTNTTEDGSSAEEEMKSNSKQSVETSSSEKEGTKKEAEVKNEVDKASSLATKEEVNFDIVSKQTEGVFTFEIVGDDFDLIEWDFGNGNYNSSKKASYFFEKPGKHKVIARVYKGNESYELVENVTIEVEGRIIKIPNTFTPDGDGINDVYFVESENLKDFHITISDENNTVVYESSDVNFVWDGFTMNGNKIEKGNYIVIITATDTNGYPINAYKRLSTK